MLGNLYKKLEMKKKIITKNININYNKRNLYIFYVKINSHSKWIKPYLFDTAFTKFFSSLFIVLSLSPIVLSNGLIL